MRTLQIACGLLVYLLGGGSALAATRTIRGLVLDGLTKDPIPFVTVSIVGTKTSVQADVDGNFAIQGDADKPVTIHLFNVDHQVKDVVVAPEQQQITVELSVSFLEEVVVVGRATEVARKNLANSVATVSREELQEVPAQTVDSALQGKVAGANIQSNSGAPGGGIQLRLRGISTINGSFSPLYVIDGVIISDVAVASGINEITQSFAASNEDNRVNRIADINPNDIENIEVLKGASAAAIYGSKASNGVVIITTKRGREGAPRLDVTQRVGTYQLSRKLGSRTFNSEDEAVAAFGEQARAAYVQGRTYDHEQELAGRSDLSTETVVSLSGGSADTRYFASLLAKDDEGIVSGTGYAKQALRLNLSHRFGEKLEVNTTANLIHSLARRGLFNNDNAGVTNYIVLSATPNFLDLRRRPDGTFPANPFIGTQANPLQTVALMKNDEDVWRMIASADATLTLLKAGAQELRLAANLGVDRFQQTNTLLFPPELYFEPLDDGLPGTSLKGFTESRNLSTGVNLVHSYKPDSNAFTATTSAGVQFEEREISSTYVTSRNLTAGQSNVDSGTQIKVSENRQLVRDRGYYLQEETLLLNERLTVVGALRVEQSSVNGDPNKPFFYPKLATAYRIPGLPRGLDELKARAAYGETGNQPLYGQKFTPLTVTNNIEGHPGITVAGTAGDPKLRPERQAEIELGVDAVGLSGRGIVELTVYQRTITDLLLRRSLAPSTGFTTQFFNGGELRNRGVELMLQASPVEFEDFRWLSRITFALNRSEIVHLPVPAFNTGGFGTGLGTFRIQEGASASQIVGNDGLLPDGTCCVVRKLGDTEPDFRMAVVEDVSYRGFTLHMLWDWQQGSQVINLTRFVYDLSSNSKDFETAGKERLKALSSSARPYIEDASYLKLRELSLSYDVPPSWLTTHLSAVRSLRFSVSARNLLTFTSYSGLDPEVNNFGNQAIARNIDVAPYPPSRSFWGSLEVGF